MLKNITLIFILFLSETFSLCAQDGYTFQYLDVNNGLSHNFASEIITDELGFKWIATAAGIDRYDGKKIIHYHPGESNRGLQNENIETLFKDKDGFIWVGTKSGGLSRYNPRKDYFESFNDVFNLKDSTELLRVTAIVQSGNGDIWIGTWDKGLYVIDSKERKLKKAYSLKNTCWDLIRDPFDNIWVLGFNKIFKFDPSENRMSTIELNLGTGYEMHYYTAHQSILIASSRGLFEFQTSDYNLEKLDLGLSFRGVNSIDFDASGNLWLGSWTDGLIFGDVDKGSFQRVSLNRENENVFGLVLDIDIDKDEIIWVSTGYAGVVRINRETEFQTLRQPRLNQNNVLAIAKDNKGHLWCGTRRGGILWSEDEESFVQVSESKATCLLQVGTYMLAGESNGILKFSTSKPTSSTKIFSELRTVMKMMLDNHKKHLWVGTQQNGLARLEVDEKGNLHSPTYFMKRKSSEAKAYLPADRISDIVEDYLGNIWIATYSGLYRYSPRRDEFERFDQRLNIPSVISLSMFTADQNLYVGVSGGLMVIDLSGKEPKLKMSYADKESLKNNYIIAITKDIEGNVWMANPPGLVRLNPQSENIFTYTSNAGVDLAPMNINSLYNDGEKLYFGGSKGVVRFKPAEITDVRRGPNVVFTSLLINNHKVRVGEYINDRILLSESIAYADQIEVTHNEKVISLSYVVDDFLSDENLKFYYRIEGLEENWVSNFGANEINLTGLPSGNYAVQVRATRDNQSFGEIATLGLKVLPPFWASNVAIAIYFLLAIAISFVIRQVGVIQAKLKWDIEKLTLEQDKEHELTESKLKFFTNISHELRTPLTMITGPISEVVDDDSISKNVRKKLQYVEKNANRLLHLINQLLDFRKAEKGGLTLKVAEGDFIKFSKEIFLSFKLMAEQKGIQYRFITNHEKLPLTFDRDKMEIVLCNLLSNAIKFTSQGGTIDFEILQENENCVVSVKDTGKGIAEEHQSKIFDRFFQIKDANSVSMMGSGIGLSLSKDIVELHQGGITLKSEQGKGTEIIASFLMGQTHFNEDSFIKVFKDSEKIDAYVDLEEPFQIENAEDNHPPVEIAGKAKYSILVVDDNEEIRQYIEGLLSEDYIVKTAEDGLAALKLAQEHMPDLIVSDVMMPKMDGIELCGKLKGNIETSHIPIILLTARTSTVYEVDGLNTGADDYVKKPFNAKVLMSRVRGTLENRRLLREYFMNKVRFEAPKDTVIENHDERFINHAMELVLENLTDEDFSVDSMAEVLCMSQSTLYRKIKALTGLSIAGFIRSVRLKKASEILLTEDLNLSGVAYAVGFNDYKYFKKSFKNQFGIPPAEYRESRLASN